MPSADWDDEETRRWIEADLERLERQRAASAWTLAEAERLQARRLQELMPVSSALAGMFRQVEAHNRSVRSCRHHEVVVRLRQPSPQCIHVSLRWGKKFALTDAEKQLMRSYQTRRRRLQRYPEVVVGHEYHELSATLDGCRNTVSLGSGEVFPVDRFAEQQATVAACIARCLSNPTLVAAYFDRSTNYSRRP